MRDELCPTTVVGIDGGGSHVDVVAIADGEIVFRGQGGPGNPLCSDDKTLAKSYSDALKGCPPANRAGACVAGAGSAAGRDAVIDVLAGLLPDAELSVGADYLAAIHAVPGHDLWVIAGTGSLVASNGGGEVVVSGGRGWLLGDHGSGARLGRALLEAYVDDPEVDVTLAAEVGGLAGSSEWLPIVRRAQTDPAPAAWMARFAPLLTARAEAGEGWAQALVAAQMTALAETAARHARRHLPGEVGTLSVCLHGGVWRSTLAVEAFSYALRGLLGEVDVTQPEMDAAVGAAAYAAARTFTGRAH